MVRKHMHDPDYRSHKSFAMRTWLLFWVLAAAVSLSGLHATEVGKEPSRFSGGRGKWGLGLEGGVGAIAFLPTKSLVAGFPDSWLALSLHIPDTSFLFSVGVAGLGFGGYGINANVDFLLGAIQPTNWLELHLFLGWGASFYGYKDGIGLSTGLRLPLGMSFWLWNWFEIYLNLTPIIGLGLGLGNPARLWLHLDSPIDLGVRFWF